MASGLENIETIESPFRRFVTTIGVFPTAFTDAMTYYECLAYLVKYLEETVIPAVNENAEALEELQTLFVQLKSYVDNYFENLDVQQEINNKLDEMAENGSLTALIKAYVDPIYEAYETRIDNRVDELDTYTHTNIASLNNMVSSVASGSPKGSYATVTALTTADPDHDYIYVVVEDGKWYYYDTGTSSWVAGGVYQSALGVIAYNDTGNLIDITTVSTNKYLQYDDQLLDNNSYNTTDFIPVEASSDYTFMLPVYCWAFYDSNKDMISASWTRPAGVPVVPLTVTSSATASYIRFSYFNYCAEPLFVAGEVTEREYERFTKKEVEGIDLSNSNYASIDKEINKVLYEEGSINLVNPNEIVEGYYLNASGTLGASASYNTTGVIEVEPSTSYYLGNRIRFLLEFDENYGVVENSYINNWTDADVITTSATTKYIRFTVASTDLAVMLVKSDEAVEYIPYSPRINQAIGLTTRMKQELVGYNASNVLTGKKLVACGDSFTAYTNAQFDSGIYIGKDKTWPYLIGLRNDMPVVNMAVSGSTMAVNSDSGHMHFADTKYTEIPADADYIIIKYGINDSHVSNPIGTIDSTDNTTFYGAWNVVLSYIIEHHPLAKIGIIVTNGLDYVSGITDNSYYATAIKNIALKYGIPTLNEWNDPNVPLLNRTARNEVADSIKDMRNNAFRVSADNTHENYQCQEYESTMVENFIRSL